MLIFTKTLKVQLEELIERHGLAEVLDRLADIVHLSKPANGSQITNLLEQATEFALAQEEAAILTFAINPTTALEPSIAKFESVEKQF